MWPIEFQKLFVMVIKSSRFSGKYIFCRLDFVKERGQYRFLFFSRKIDGWREGIDFAYMAEASSSLFIDKAERIDFFVNLNAEILDYLRCSWTLLHFHKHFIVWEKEVWSVGCK